MAGEKKISNDAFKTVVNIIILILGIVLIAQPTAAMQVLTIIVGIILIAYGVISILVSVNKRKKGVETPNIAFPIIWMIVGVLLLVFNGAFANAILPFVIGVWVLVVGIMNLTMTSKMKSLGVGSWKAEMVMALIALVLGVVIIVGVFTGGNVLGTLLGVCMLIFGIVSIVEWAATASVRKK